MGFATLSIIIHRLGWTNSGREFFVVGESEGIFAKRLNDLIILYKCRIRLSDSHAAAVAVGLLLWARRPGARRWPGAAAARRANAGSATLSADVGS